MDNNGLTLLVTVAATVIVMLLLLRRAEYQHDDVLILEKPVVQPKILEFPIKDQRFYTDEDVHVDAHREIQKNLWSESTGPNPNFVYKVHNEKGHWKAHPRYASIMALVNHLEGGEPPEHYY